MGLLSLQRKTWLTATPNISKHSTLAPLSPQQLEGSLPALIQTVISSKDNMHIITLPSEEEVRVAVFSIGRDKAPGPDGFNSNFFQQYWGLLRHDVMKIVQTFFSIGELDPSSNGTFIVLILKKEGGQSWRISARLAYAMYAIRSSLKFWLILLDPSSLNVSRQFRGPSCQANVQWKISS